MQPIAPWGGAGGLGGGHPGLGAQPLLVKGREGSKVSPGLDYTQAPPRAQRTEPAICLPNGHGNAVRCISGVGRLSTLQQGARKRHTCARADGCSRHRLRVGTNPPAAGRASPQRPSLPGWGQQSGRMGVCHLSVLWSKGPGPLAQRGMPTPPRGMDRALLLEGAGAPKCSLCLSFLIYQKGLIPLLTKRVSIKGCDLCEGLQQCLPPTHTHTITPKPCHARP